MKDFERRVPLLNLFTPDQTSCVTNDGHTSWFKFCTFQPCESRRRIISGRRVKLRIHQSTFALCLRSSLVVGTSSLDMEFITGVHLSSSVVKFTSAPCIINADAISVYPLLVASANGVKGNRGRSKSTESMVRALCKCMYNSFESELVH